MKQTIKRALAVFVAALLATMGPVGALSEGIVTQGVSEETMPAKGAEEPEGSDVPGGNDLSDDDVVSENVEEQVEEVVLELGAPAEEPASPSGDAAPFEQSVTLEGVTFTVTGGYAAGELRAEPMESAEAARAVEAAVGEGAYTHRLYRLEINGGRAAR